MPGCWRRHTKCRCLCPSSPTPASVGYWLSWLSPSASRRALCILSPSPPAEDGERKAARPFPLAHAHSARMHRTRTTLCCEVTGPAFRPDRRCGLHWPRGCRKTCRLSHGNILHCTSCISCMLALLALRVIAALRCVRKPKLGLDQSAPLLSLEAKRPPVASHICVVSFPL